MITLHHSHFLLPFGFFSANLHDISPTNPFPSSISQIIAASVYTKKNLIEWDATKDKQRKETSKDVTGKASQYQTDKRSIRMSSLLPCQYEYWLVHSLLSDCRWPGVHHLNRATEYFEPITYQLQQTGLKISWMSHSENVSKTSEQSREKLSGCHQ